MPCAGAAGRPEGRTRAAAAGLALDANFTIRRYRTNGKVDNPTYFANVLICGYALSFNALTRQTGDVDILVPRPRKTIDAGPRP
ncbi:hypothetical protein ABH994_006511 [Bradyrhizobium yuanmingense]